MENLIGKQGKKLKIEIIILINYIIKIPIQNMFKFMHSMIKLVTKPSIQKVIKNVKIKIKNANQDLAKTPSVNWLLK